MLQATASKPIRTNFYYGWVIVFVGGLGVFFSGPGQTYSNSIFINYYIQDFGWSRSLVSSIYSIATLCAGLLLFIVGRFVDKFGQRNMTLAIGLLFGLACFWNSAVIGPITLFIGFFLIRLLGQGSMTLIPNTLVPQWFIAKRGRALSFMALGGFLSSAAIPPLNAWLITNYDWSFTWKVWGFLIILIFVPVAFFLIRNKPEDIGLLPDNAEANPKIGKNQPAPISEIDWTLKEAMRTKAFWLILFCAGIPALVNTGLTFHLISILGESGLKTTTAALILSLVAVIGFPVTMVAGFIIEKFKVHYVLAFIFIGQISFMIILLFTNSIYMAILFGVIWGISGGFERIALGIIWPNYFGRKYIGSIKGVAMTTMVIMSAFGPLPFGVAYDIFGGYNEILLISLVLPILGFLSAFFAPAPTKQTEAKS
jgi:MFS family permease